MNYDVIIVGAGPIGSTFAYQIAKKGHKVALFDKKKDIGEPLQCAGIIDKKILELNELPEECILNKVRGANIYSPDGNSITVAKEEIEAFVIDRVRYDKYLVKRAVDNGVSLFNPREVTEIDTEKGIVILSDGEQFTAKVIVGADGPNSILSRSMGNSVDYYYGSQYLVEIPSVDELDFVNLYMDGEITPGFIWAIPISNNLLRLGLFSDKPFKQHNVYLNKILSSFEDYTVLDKHYGMIPKHDPDKILVKGSVILLGDAASQIKPTSGGGLNIGLQASKIACDVVDKVLSADDISLLKEYAVNYDKAFHRELYYQLKIHRTFALLGDEDLNYTMDLLKKNDVEEVVSKYGSIDSQSYLIKEVIKRGWLLKIFPKLLTHNILKLWK